MISHLALIVLAASCALNLADQGSSQGSDNGKGRGGGKGQQPTPSPSNSGGGNSNNWGDSSGGGSNDHDNHDDHHDHDHDHYNYGYVPIPNYGYNSCPYNYQWRRGWNNVYGCYPVYNSCPYGQQWVQVQGGNWVCVRQQYGTYYPTQQSGVSVVLGRRRLKDESTSQDQNGGGLMGVLEIGDVELGGLVGDEGLGGVIIIGNKSLIGGLGNKVSTPPRRLLHNAMVMKKQGRRRLLS